MSNLAPRFQLGLADYLAGERTSPVKHEYIAGEVFAMAGASETHVTIAGNLFALLRAAVRGGPCRVYISDMKLRVAATDSVFYPDVFVTCSDRSAPPDPYVRDAATLIVEVLSPSTEAYDRGAKFAHYRQLESLREYVLIDSTQRQVEVFRRAEAGWILLPIPPDGRLDLTALDFACTLDAIYEDATFDSAPP